MKKIILWLAHPLILLALFVFLDYYGTGELNLLLNIGKTLGICAICVALWCVYPKDGSCGCC